MPPTNREVEIRLTLLPSATYSVEVRDIDPANDAVDDVFSGSASFEFDTLRAAESDNDEYGRALSRMLFESAAVKSRFEMAFADSSKSGTPLNLRLYIDASAANLNAIRWELLRHPSLDVHLTASERIYFSRFVTTSKWNSVKRRAKSRFRALIAVSNPGDLEDFDSNLKPIPVESLVPAARAALVPFAPDAIGAAPDDYLTRSALIDRLREGPGYDILYLVCHGSLKAGIPKLYFQGTSGETAELSGDDFVRDLANLKSPPRLIVLASCESGARDGKFAESALAPRLAAEAGIPAILAMQAKVAIATADLIMPVFFNELVKDGQADRAMAVARGTAIRAGARDAWVPALYSRLRDGRLWYTPGFGDDKDESALPWNSICLAVQNKEIVPVLGPDLGEHILGSTAEFAKNLAEMNGIPLPPDARPDLPRIAQTIEKKESRSTLEAHCNTLVAERLRRLAAELPAPPGSPNASAPERIAYAASKDPGDPFRILCGLDLKVYVSCAMDSILKQFLKSSDRKKFPIELFTTWRDESTSVHKRVVAAGKALRDLVAASPSTPPAQLIAQWRQTLLVPKDAGVLPDELAAAVDAIAERFRFFPNDDPVELVTKWLELLEHPPYELISKPWNTDTPIIYYAFGRYTYKKTWVLTQDDFFSYLIQHSRFPLVPSMVSAKLASGSLLFLGFSLDDWTFRILLRLIRSQEGAHQLKSRRHIGVQIDPENYSPSEAAKVKSILSRYLVDDAFTIDVYWGTSADFLRDLRDRMNDPRYQATAAAAAAAASVTQSGDDT